MADTNYYIPEPYELEEQINTHDTFPDPNTLYKFSAGNGPINLGGKEFQTHWRFTSPNDDEQFMEVTVNITENATEAYDLLGGIHHDKSYKFGDYEYSIRIHSYSYDHNHVRISNLRLTLKTENPRWIHSIYKYADDLAFFIELLPNYGITPDIHPEKAVEELKHKTIVGITKEIYFSRGKILITQEHQSYYNYDDTFGIDFLADEEMIQHAMPLIVFYAKKAQAKNKAAEAINGIDPDMVAIDEQYKIKVAVGEAIKSGEFDSNMEAFSLNRRGRR